MVLVLVGDSPSSVVRWHYHNDTGGRWGMIVDRLVGPSLYHRQGYAYRCLYAALLAAKTSGIPIDYVIAYVPQLAEFVWVGHKLSAAGFHVVNDSPQYVWCRMDMYTMRLDLRRSVDSSGISVSEFDNLLAYLLQKSSVNF